MALWISVSGVFFILLFSEIPAPPGSTLAGQLGQLDEPGKTGYLDSGIFGKIFPALTN